LLLLLHGLRDSPHRAILDEMPDSPTSMTLPIMRRAARHATRFQQKVLQSTQFTCGNHHQYEESEYRTP
jgi:hypothetical protein